ncbi:MAG: hypothetical protein SFU55_03640 [Methylophilus sp.]|nr:hypothetical protein [Methylophilus sp.]
MLKHLKLWFMILVLIPLWGIHAKENVQTHSSMNQSGLSLSYTLTANKLGDLHEEENGNEEIKIHKELMPASTPTTNNEVLNDAPRQVISNQPLAEPKPNIANTSTKSSQVAEEDNFGLASLLILFVGLIIAGILRMLMVT